MKEVCATCLGAFRIEAPIPFGSGTCAFGRKAEQTLEICREGGSDACLSGRSAGTNLTRRSSNATASR